MRPGFAPVAGILALLLSACIDAAVGPVTPIELTYDFSDCPVYFRPRWFGHQDGQDAPWSRDSSVADTYTAVIHGPVAAIGYQIGGPILVDLFTRPERRSEAVKMCGDGPAAGVTVSGVARGLSSGRVAAVWIDGRLGLPSSEDGTYSISGLAPGTYDVLAFEESALLGEGPAPKIILRRDVAITGNTTIDAIDFASAESFEAESAAVAVGNAGADATQMRSLLFSGASCRMLVLPDPPTAGTVYVIPANRRRAGDVHVIQAWATTADGGYRYVQQSFRSWTSLAVTLGPALPSPEVGPLGSTTYTRLQARVVLPAEYRESVEFSYEAGDSLLTSVKLRASAGYVATAGRAHGTATEVTLAAPDLPQAFWPSERAWSAAQSGVWSVTAHGAATGAICDGNARYADARIEGWF